jgi:hypothetical protein
MNHNYCFFALLAMFFAAETSTCASQREVVEVNIYSKLGPVYHAGIVIGKTEYYFDSDNHVKSSGEVRQVHGWRYTRTVRRSVAMSHKQVVESFKKVRDQWDGTRYDLLQHSCIWFVQSVLDELQVEGLDREYLHNSGFQKICLVPGASTLTELLKLKNGPKSVRLIEAGAADLQKLARFPKDTLREANSARSKVTNLAKASGKKVSTVSKSSEKRLSDGAKAAGKTLSNAAKSTGKKASDSAKEAVSNVTQVFKLGH